MISSTGGSLPDKQAIICLLIPGVFDLDQVGCTRRGGSVRVYRIFGIAGEAAGDVLVSRGKAWLARQDIAISAITNTAMRLGPNVMGDAAALPSRPGA